MKRIKLLTPILILGIAFLSSCGSKDEKGGLTERYVKSTVVKACSGDSEAIYNGVVKERRQVTLSFKVGGPVNKLLVDEGDFVEKGQVIASIDKRDYSTQLQAAEAQHSQAKAEYERYLQLYERRMLPENTLDKLKAAFLMTKSKYEAALHAYDDTDLKAPFSGYVNNKLIENFETVSPGMPIVELLDLSDMEVVINIPESQIATFSKDSKIKCDIRNANQHNLSARVKSISKKSGADRMFEVKIVLEGQVGKNVKPGMIAKVYTTQQMNADNGVLVPIESVFAEGNEKYIWYVESTSMEVKKIPVQIEKICGEGLVKIKSEIHPGDVIVSAGVHSLVEGQKIKFLPKKSESNYGGLL